MSRYAIFTYTFESIKLLLIEMLYRIAPSFMFIIAQISMNEKFSLTINSRFTRSFSITFNENVVMLTYFNRQQNNSMLNRQSCVSIRIWIIRWERSCNQIVDFVECCLRRGNIKSGSINKIHHYWNHARPPPPLITLLISERIVDVSDLRRILFSS